MAARNPFASSDFYDPYALVQTRRPRHSTGYYFLRNLLLVGGIAGGLVAAYRNDVFRDLARKAGQEQRYLDAEKFLVGSPGWGTPRSMEPVLKEAADAETAPASTQGTGTDPSVAALAGTSAPATEPAVGTSDAPAATTQPAPVPQPVAAAPSPAPEPPLAARSPSPEPTPTPAVPAPVRRAGRDSLSPVSLDSLPVLNKGTPVQPAAFAPARPTSVPTHVAAAAPAPRTPPAAPAPRPAPVDDSRAKAIKVTLDEDAPAAPRTSPFVRHNAPPPPAPPPEPAPKPVAAKPEKPEPPKSKASDVHSGDNPLLAAVRGAVRARPAKESVPAAK